MSDHPGTVFLTDFATRQPENYSFYMATEGENLVGSNQRTPRAATIAGCFDGPEGTSRSMARYQTVAGSASHPADYTQVVPGTQPGEPGQTDWICNDAHEQGCDPQQGGVSGQPTRPLPISLTQNGVAGDAVKTFDVTLTAAQIEARGNLGVWSSTNVAAWGRSRSFHIVDDDGANRFSLEPVKGDASKAVTYSRGEFGELWIPVFRAGGGNGPNPSATTANYQLAPSGDHPATPASGSTDNDFRDLTNGTVTFPATWSPNPRPFADALEGPRLGWIKVRLYRDFIGEHDETFDVVLTSPNNPDGVTITTVTIEDSDGGPDNEPPGDPIHPLGKLHHPKQSFKYPRNYPYLNEIHLFTLNAMKLGRNHPDYDDWRVLSADLAIRKRFKSGKCVWWNGRGKFVARGCNQPRWFDMQRGGEDYFLSRIKNRLPISVGSKSRVKDYKVWSRWFDAQDNESKFRKGANMNRFEVIRGTKACRNNPYGSKCKPVKPK